MDFAEDSETVSKSVYFELNIVQDLCKASRYFISVIKASEPRKSRGKNLVLLSAAVLVMNSLILYRRKMYGNGRKNY